MQKGSFWKYLLVAFVSESTLHVILQRKPFSEKIGLKVKFNIGISQKFLISTNIRRKLLLKEVDFSL